MKVEMVIRVWAPTSKGLESASAEHVPAQHPGVLALIEDVVASKRGVFVTSRDRLYVSGLTQPTDALVVSRRIQACMQGFRRNHGAASVAVSIAIDANSQTPKTARQQPNFDVSLQSDLTSTSASQKIPEPSHDLLTLLKLSKPAQILLTHDLCLRIAAIRGVPLKSFPERFGVSEYLWTTEDKLDLLQSEPQLTLAALPSPRPVQPAFEAASETAAGPAHQADAAVEPFGNQQRLTGMAQPRRAAMRSPRALIFVALAVCAIAVVSVVGIRMGHISAVPTVKTTAPASAPLASAAQPVPVAANPAANEAKASPPPSASASTGTNSTAPATSNAADVPRKSRKAALAEKRAAAASAPSPACNLADDPSRLVRLAEQYRGRGDYKNAVRIFRQVLSCQPNNAAAREGLNRAAQAVEQSRQ